MGGGAEVARLITRDKGEIKLKLANVRLLRKTISIENEGGWQTVCDYVLPLRFQYALHNSCFSIFLNDIKFFHAIQRIC